MSQFPSEGAAITDRGIFYASGVIPVDEDRRLKYRSEYKNTGWNHFRVLLKPINDPGLKTIEKLVYVILSKYADVEDGSCFPSYDKVAADASCSRRSVIEAIKNLVEAGYIRKEIRQIDNWNLTNTFIIDTGISAGAALSGVQEIPGGSAGAAPEQEPYNKNHLTSSGSAGDSTGTEKAAKPFWDDFEALWKLYPRKHGKTAAYRCYLARRREGVDQDTLILAVKNYAKDRAGSEERFIKHGSTFLGRDRHWEDFAGGKNGDHEEPEVGTYTCPDCNIEFPADRLELHLTPCPQCGLPAHWFNEPEEIRARVRRQYGSP
jgi:hypothetical protein